MRPISPKEYFAELRRLRSRADLLECRAEHLRRRLSVSACRTDAIRVRGGRDCPVTEEVLIRLTDTHQELHDALLELHSRQEEAEQLIRMLREPELRIVLLDRYVRGLPWEEIADGMFVCLRQTQRLHGSALRKLEPMYEEFVHSLGETVAPAAEPVPTVQMREFRSRPLKNTGEPRFEWVRRAQHETA